MTDSQGKWSIKALPEGTYIITVDSSGLGGMIPENVPDENKPDTKEGENKANKKKQSPFSKLEKEISVSGDLTDITLELSDGASISGKAVLANGKPFDGMAYVRAESLNAKRQDGDDSLFDKILDGQFEAGRIGKDGEFLLTRLPAGPVYLDVETIGAYYVKSIKAGGADLTNAPLNLNEGAEIKNVQVIIGDDPARLRGVINSPDNKPAFGKGVLLIPSDPAKWRSKASSKNYGYTVTDTRGEFSLTVAPGEYFIVATQAETDLTGITPEWIRANTANARRILLKPNDRQTVTLSALQ